MEGFTLMCYSCAHCTPYLPSQNTDTPCCPLCQSHFVEILDPSDPSNEDMALPHIHIIPLASQNGENSDGFAISFGLDNTGMTPNPRNALDLIRLMMNPSAFLHNNGRGGAATSDYVFGESAFERVLDSLLHQGGHPTFGLTTEQMDELPRDIFGEGRVVEGTCAICQDSYKRGEELIRLKCEHSFHANCLEVWLRKAASCPICRTNPL